MGTNALVFFTLGMKNVNLRTNRPACAEPGLLQAKISVRLCSAWDINTKNCGISGKASERNQDTVKTPEV